MNARLLNFSLASLCVHIAVPWLLLHAGAFERGAARGMASMERMLTIELVSGEDRLHAAATAQSKDMFPMPEPDSSIDTAAEPPASPPAAASDIADAAQTAVARDYATPGRLTKLAAPLSDIDLNVPDISASGFRGEANLTLLIDTDGSVADVIGGEGLPGQDDFARHVAARFRSALFMPGEIDGKPVKSQLPITVVSENPATGS